MSLLFTFFGDDNTGSTDSMEALAKGGVNTVLFLSPPAPGDLLRFPGVQAVGVAGMTRTMAPNEMQEVLTPAFAALKSLGAPLCHYKICSTFDSSPHVGSIGTAIDVGARVFEAKMIPLLVGAPALRRYTLFGNLFATVGSETHRLDRHPTMSRHPITPMDEGDLRVHLAKQTSKRIGLFDILALQGSYADVTCRFDAALAQSQAEVMLFDVLDEERLATAGELLWRQTNVGSRFVVGSSGVPYALVHAFRSHGLVPRTSPTWAAIRPVKQLLAVSGSCSPVTQSQIEHALGSERGFEGFDVDVLSLLDPSTAAGAREAAVQQALRILDLGLSPLLYSARGPHDERIKRVEAMWRSKNINTGGAGRALGEQLGMIVRAALERFNQNGPRLQRVVVAGGDTSGHAARCLGVQALSVIGFTAPGSPLCRAHSSDALVDGLEVLLKGGQVGQPDFFTSVRDGRFR